MCADWDEFCFAANKMLAIDVRSLVSAVHCCAGSAPQEVGLS